MSLIENLRQWRHTILPLPLKYGKDFRKIISFLKSHQDKSKEEILTYQWQRTKALISYAHQHVPYYKKLFKKISLHPKDINTPQDFRQIPILYKEDVVNNLESLKSDQFEKFNPIKTVTSATTRDGLVCYRSEYAETFRNAIVWRHFHNIGYDYRNRKAILSTIFKFLNNPIIMPIDYNENCLLLDPRILKSEFIELIYKRLKDFSPKMLFAQPSGAAILVEYFQKAELSKFEIPIVYLLGENLYPHYIKQIKKYFDCRIVEYYGNKENTASAFQLDNQYLYENSELCYLEFENNNNPAKTGKPGDIISTALENYAFPLIRYHTEDYGIDRGYPENTKLNYRQLEIIGGRGKDLLLTKNGLSWPYLLLSIKNSGFDSYKRVQLEQVSMSKIIIRLIPSEDFDYNNDPPAIIRSVTASFNNEFNVELELVNQINPTAGNKHKFVISDLAVNYMKNR